MNFKDFIAENNLNKSLALASKKKKMKLSLTVTFITIKAFLFHELITFVIN